MMAHIRPRPRGWRPKRLASAQFLVGSSRLVPTSKQRASRAGGRHNKRLLLAGS